MTLTEGREEAESKCAEKMEKSVSSTKFLYLHPSTNYSVELAVMDCGAVKCPGCGDPKKQLVRHLKRDH